MITRFMARLLADRAGAVIIYVGIVLPVVLGFVSLGVDATMVHYNHGRLQNTADATALAAAAVLPSNKGTITSAQTAVVVAEAQSFAEKNMSAASFGSVLVANDVEVGHWDGDGSHGNRRTFYLAGSLPVGVTINAVRVTARRTQANGNPVPLVAAMIFGDSTFDLTTTAIATSTADHNCLTTSITALGIAEGGSQNTILDGFCIHGEDGVKLGSQNCFEGGEDLDSQSSISMPNPTGGLGNGGYDLGSDNEVVPESDCNDGAYSNNDLPNTVQKRSISDFVDGSNFIFDLSKPAGHSAHINSVNTKIDYLRNNYASEFPPGVIQTVIEQDDYVIPSDSTISNVLIISDTKITIGSNVTLTNTFLLAKENVEMGSNITIGSPTYCNNPSGQVFVLAGEQAKFGSNNNIYGSQIIAGNYVDYGSDNVDVIETSILSGGDVKFGSTWLVRGCGNYGANQSLDPGKNVDLRARLVK